jgi:hypothetical protein
MDSMGHTNAQTTMFPADQLRNAINLRNADNLRAQRKQETKIRPISAQLGFGQNLGQSTRNGAAAIAVSA